MTNPSNIDTPKRPLTDAEKVAIGGFAVLLVTIAGIVSAIAMTNAHEEKMAKIQAGTDVLTLDSALGMLLILLGFSVLLLAFFRGLSYFSVADDDDEDDRAVVNVDATNHVRINRIQGVNAE
ncbi:MAG TPA: hypothetical protein VM286_04350 [Candidatus Thermoplasmatota archaeon]|nr:hypothetical protein [Candidatus Thermoplasmatota archaeon]